MIATELKTGTIFKENGTPFVVLKYSHIKVARGGANVKVKARDLLTGSVFEKSYIATAKVEDADVVRKNAQFLFDDSQFLTFMDPDTYEQVRISHDTMGDDADFLQEGENVQIMYFEGNPVSVDLPNSIISTVTYTEPGFRGNTVTNTFKDATLENGVVVKVPTFIKIGDKVKVDTRTREYVSKA